MEHKTIISGRIGIPDAALLCFLEKEKKPPRQLVMQITGSIFRELIPEVHLEEFISAFSIVDQVLPGKLEINREKALLETRPLQLPEQQLLRYSLGKILKSTVCMEDQPCLQSSAISNIRNIKESYGPNPLNRRLMVGLVSGSFDLIHPGHIRYIKKAKENVDVLVVAAMDSHAIKQQAKNRLGDRPIYSEADRVKVLSALRYVDHLVVFNEPDCRNVIRAVRPNIFFKNRNDLSRKIVREECALVENLGGKVLLTKDDAGYSSTDIINYIRSANKKEGCDVFINL